MTVQELNALPDHAARDAFGACCGTPRWVSRMVSERPFSGRAAVLSTADEAWRDLSAEDWAVAIAHHPRIGFRAVAPANARASAWSADEQAGVIRADEATRAAIAEGNLEYERRFGHPFIICAAGKSAREILSALQTRLAHEASAELERTAEELRKITMLRLEKLLAES